MPVQVIIDTSDATAAEKAAFHAAVDPSVVAITKAASTLGFDLTHRSSAASPSRVSQSDVYKETMATLRYFGGVRYIFLPTYFTAMAALSSQYFKIENEIPEILLVGAGIMTSVIFLAFEISISNNIRVLWAEVEKMIGGQKVFPAGLDPLAHRAGKWRLRILRVLLGMPYVSGLLFWSSLAALQF